MFRELFDRIDEIHKHLQHEGHFWRLPYELDTIAGAIVAKSSVEEIRFVSVDVNRDDDPIILGKVEIFERSPGAYALPVTSACIFYSSELDNGGKRLVVCKEMAQLLVPGARVQTVEEYLRLVDALVLPQQKAEIFKNFPPFASESLAHLAAMDLLCPVSLRLPFIEKLEREEMARADVAALFGIPESYVETLFDRQVHDVLSQLRELSLKLPPGL